MADVLLVVVWWEVPKLVTSVEGVGLAFWGMTVEEAPVFDLTGSRVKPSLLSWREYLSLCVLWEAASCITGVWAMLGKFGGGWLTGEILRS